MVDGPTAEARQLRLLHAEPELAAQADQGGNLPLHYAASAGVKPAVAVACALAFPGALSWADKRGRAPLEIAELEGHRGVASVLSGLANRQRNELHDAFAAGAEADEQLRLLRCRPELAAQRDGGGALPSTSPRAPARRRRRPTRARAPTPTARACATTTAFTRISSHSRRGIGSSPSCWPPPPGCRSPPSPSTRCSPRRRPRGRRGASGRRGARSRNY